ncbi:MAG: response regulator transcription factor [Cytophagales bacterium]|nr:response regulator transcription factor [Cytophagales bacterium]
MTKEQTTDIIKILLVDDHAIITDGLRSVLNAQEAYEVVGTVNSAEEAIKFLDRASVDLMVSDYSLPGMDGLGLVRYTKKSHPNLKIIILSMHRESHLVKEILKEGILGYVLKDDPAQELLQAIEKAKGGKVYLSDDINKMLIESLHFQQDQKLFSDREREILKLIAQEHSSKQIADILFISERTVESHKRNMMKKAGTNTSIGLVNFGYQNNLI